MAYNDLLKRKMTQGRRGLPFKPPATGPKMHPGPGPRNGIKLPDAMNEPPKGQLPRVPGNVSQKTKRIGSRLNEAELKRRVARQTARYQGLKGESGEKTATDPKKLAAIRRRLMGYRVALSKDVLGQKSFNKLRGNPGLKQRTARYNALSKKLGPKYKTLYGNYVPRLKPAPKKHGPDKPESDAAAAPKRQAALDSAMKRHRHRKPAPPPTGNSSYGPIHHHRRHRHHHRVGRPAPPPTGN